MANSSKTVISEDTEWQAKWIWGDGPESPRN
ncbi:MAG: hypothetical protein K0Q81_1446, partial [Paenibacillus sp.]|nr:hypothetical protein [Paenibacillus sp.]